MGDSSSHGRRYQRSQSEVPSSGSSGKHPHQHRLSDPSPQFPTEGRYYHVSGTPLGQSPNPYLDQQQLHATESSAQDQLYPRWLPCDPWTHDRKFSAPGVGLSSAPVGTTSDYAGSFGHGSSSGANFMQQQAPGHYNASEISFSECMPTGDLHISVHKARGIEGKEFWNKGKADPYVVLTLDDQKQKTKTDPNGGSNPDWNQILPFLVKSVDTNYNKLSIKIYDANAYPRDHTLLGTLEISNLGQSVLQNRTKLSAANWYPVFRHGDKKGEILLAFRFFPQSPQQMLNNLGNKVGPADNVKEDPHAEYFFKTVGGVVTLMLRGAAVGLAIAAL